MRKLNLKLKARAVVVFAHIPPVLNLRNLNLRWAFHCRSTIWFYNLVKTIWMTRNEKWLDIFQIYWRVAFNSSQCLPCHSLTHSQPNQSRSGGKSWVWNKLSVFSVCLFEIIPFEIKAIWNWKWKQLVTGSNPDIFYRNPLPQFYFFVRCNGKMLLEMETVTHKEILHICCILLSSSMIYKQLKRDIH